MKLIILEGPDGSGKSTVIQELLKQKGLAPKSLVTHWVRPWPKEDETIAEHLHTVLANYYRELKAKEVEYWIWDRSFMTNYLYGNFHKDKKRLDFMELTALVRRLDVLFSEVHWFLFRSSRKDLAAHLKKKNELHITSAQEAYDLGKQYQDLFQHFRQCHRENLYLSQNFHLLPRKATIQDSVDTISKYL